MPDPGEPHEDDYAAFARYLDAVDDYVDRVSPRETEIAFQATLNALELETLLREAAGE